MLTSLFLLFHISLVTSQYPLPAVRSDLPSPEYSFFFRPDNVQRPSRGDESTTQQPITSTHKEFTGIAFPPQVFEILTGAEPTTQNLGGRKNATMTTTIHNATNIESTTTSRPPTRFPPNNKPSYIRPTTKPTNRPLLMNRPQQSRPQPGSIAAAPTTTTENVNDRIGNPTTVKPIIGSCGGRLPCQSPVVTQQKPNTKPPGQAVTKYKEVLRSIRAMHLYLQDALTSSNLPRWDGVHSNFLVSPMSVGLTMAQMLMAGGPKSKSYLRNILHLYPKTEPNEQVRQEVVYHKMLGELIRSIQRRDTPSTVSSSAWNRASADPLPYTLTLDTAVFAQSGLMVRPAFIHSVEALYQSRVSLLDFSGDPSGSVSFINKWAEEVSRGKIKNFLTSPPSPNTAALFSSSLYFKAPWRDSFGEEYTMDGKFHVTPEETITVPFMNGELTNGVKYIDSDRFGLKALRLAYNQTDEVAMYMIISKNQNISVLELAKKLLRPYVKVVVPRQIPLFNKNFQDPLPPSWEAHKHATLSATNTRNDGCDTDIDNKWLLDEVISNMEYRNVITTIPKFTLRGSLRLNPPGNGGTKDQLAGLLEEPTPQTLAQHDSILHETVLEITETGTEAAAITSGVIDLMKTTGIFRADRPFLILLRHELSGIPLFWGGVVRPTFVPSSVEN